MKDYFAQGYQTFTSASAFSASSQDGLAVSYPANTPAEVLYVLDYDGLAYSAARLDPPLPGNALMLLDSAGRYEGLAFFQRDVFDLCDEELPGCVDPFRDLCRTDTDFQERLHARNGK